MKTFRNITSWLMTGLAITTASLTASAADSNTDCTVTVVGVDVGKRVGIACAVGMPGHPEIVNFAIATTDAAANQFMTLANSAFLAGKKLQVTADFNDTAGLPTGCAAANCRKAKGFAIK